jgi:thiosulfate dehydrogenase [quinone] large subunit
MEKIVTTKSGERVVEPRPIHFLLSDPRAGWLWLVPRVWLGWQWLEAGWHKVTDPAWTQTGESIRAFWERAVVIPVEGRAPITFDWYRSFIQALIDADAQTWFSPMIAYGELIVGAALILGAFTGIAAFFGGLMNWNFMMAGSASSNPLLFAVAVGLIMAWKVSGYIGLDHYLLRRLGTPWHPEKEPAATPPASPQLSGA